MIALALWLAFSPVVGCLAGRCIRVGMVELQPDHTAIPQEG